MRNWSFIVGLIALITLAACECDDCGPLVFNPKFDAKFINKDSLESIVIITQITNRENGESMVPDTSNVYQIPLPLGTGQQSASFEFLILGNSYNLDVTFNAIETVDALGKIRLSVSDLTINESTMGFDTLIIQDGPIYQFEF